MALKAFKNYNNKAIGDNRIDKIFKNLFKFEKQKIKKIKNLTYIKAMKKFIFLTFNIKKGFTY